MTVASAVAANTSTTSVGQEVQVQNVDAAAAAALEAGIIATCSATHSGYRDGGGAHRVGERSRRTGAHDRLTAGTRADRAQLGADGAGPDSPATGRASSTTVRGGGRASPTRSVRNRGSGRSLPGGLG